MDFIMIPRNIRNTRNTRDTRDTRDTRGNKFIAGLKPAFIYPFCLNFFKSLFSICY